MNNPIEINYMDNTEIFPIHVQKILIATRQYIFEIFLEAKLFVSRLHIMLPMEF